MFMFLRQCLLAFLICMTAHELGHWLVARFYGYSIKFKFQLSRLCGIPVPRGVWEMPAQADGEQQITIALAGFQCEIIVALILLPFLWQAAAVAILHFLVYKYYAGENNDFNFVK